MDAIHNSKKNTMDRIHNNKRTQWICYGRISNQTCLKPSLLVALSMASLLVVALKPSALTARTRQFLKRPSVEARPPLKPPFFTVARFPLDPCTLSRSVDGTLLARYTESTLCGKLLVYGQEGLETLRKLRNQSVTGV